MPYTLAPLADVAPANSEQQDVLHGGGARARIGFLDVARVFVIALATLSHGYRAFTEPYGNLGHSLEKFLYPAARAATPLFLILLGLMLEWVYVRRAEAGGISAVAGRMLKRAFQCYADFLVVAAGAALGLGRLSVFTDAIGFGSAPENS